MVEDTPPLAPLKELTPKEILEKRLKDLEKLKFNHEQDTRELSYVIDGLKAQIAALN